MSSAVAVLAGCGVAVPPLAVDNATMARVLETTDEWVRERSGIVTRHFVEEGIGSATLGAQAARAALADAGMEAGEIDYLVCATMTPDHYFPGCGTQIQQEIGAPTVPALDLRQQCAGFAYGLQVVQALVGSGVARNVLLVGTDVHTSLMPFSRRTWDVLLGRDEGPLPAEEIAWNSRFRHLVVLFGDAAGAMVFRADSSGDGRGILGAELHGDGAHRQILYVPGVGSAHRPFVTPEQLARGDAVPVMEGRQVYKFAVTRMPEVTLRLLELHGYGIDDLDLLVMHQANLRINEAAQKVLGLPDDRVHNNIQKYGNTTSATLPLCFHEARELGKAKPGSLVAFAALGAGLHWGAVLLRL